jgi:hypothetical protein
MEFRPLPDKPNATGDVTALLAGAELPPRPVAIHIGLDVAAGRSATADFTAICVCEVLERVRADAPLPKAPYSVDQLEMETAYRVRWLRRLPHQLTWPQMGAAIVAALCGLHTDEMARLRARGGTLDDLLPKTLYADRTGVGDALVGILQQALQDESRTRDIFVVPLSFVAGEKFDRTRGVVGKLRLISRLQALFATENKRVELPKDDPIFPTLLEELEAYQFKISEETGAETLGGVGAHDDLVTALALVCLDDPRDYLPRHIPFAAPGFLR